MVKLLLIFITTFLFGFNSNKIETTILNSGKSTSLINKDIKKGLTGYVIQNGMMIAKVISLGGKKVKYLPLTMLKNSALASPNLFPKKGDKIIFGLYNFRGLMIAPNQSIYQTKIKQYPNVKWINSDIFVTYFVTKPEKSDFQNFCKNFKVGFIDFVLDKEYIMDCNSFAVLEEKDSKSAPYHKPFFTTDTDLTKTLFSSVPTNWISYYKTLLKK